jgi:hypothetical protein
LSPVREPDRRQTAASLSRGKFFDIRIQGKLNATSTIC